MRAKQTLAITALFAGLAGAATAQISFTNSNSMLPTNNIHSGVPMAVADMNGDKLDDIVRLDDRRDLIIAYQQPGGMFTELNYGQVGSGTKWAVWVGDIDNNGYNDIACGGAYNNIDILMANSTGTAYTYSNPPGASLFVQGSNFADIDNDGWLDMFSCHDDGESFVWGNDGTGSFVQQSGWLDMTTFPTSDGSGNYGSTWTDYDDDGDLDLYIAKCRQGVTDPNDGRRINMLFINDGNNNFTQDTADASGLRIGLQSWTADFQDIDNDGDFDCFVTNHDGDCQLLENTGGGTFTDITAASGITIAGLAIQGLFQDFDNDGFVDLIVPGGVQHLYRNNGDKTFTDFTYVLDNNNMESCAIGDLNHDGFLDIYGGYATPFNTPTSIDDVLWMNDGNDNHFIAVDLEGTTSNRNAVGAKLKLYGDWGVQVREVRAGESYGIHNSFTMHFGIGQSTEADSLVIEWPAGGKQTVTNVAANQFLNVIEGTCVGPPANVTADGPLAFCTGGGSSLTLSAPAGYNYTWSGGETTQDLTITTAGTYWVEVEDNGCTSTSPAFEVIVDPDETPTVMTSGDTEFCQGETVVLTSSSASGNTWSNGETTQSITVDASGSYTVTFDGACDDFTSDPVTVNVIAFPADPAADDVTLQEPGVAMLTATSGNNVYWYANATGGAPLASGATFEPNVSETTTYYLEDVNGTGPASGNAGKNTYSGDGGGENNPNFNGWLEFDADEEFTIVSVMVFAFGEADRTFELRDENGTVLQSTTLTVADGEQVVELNFEVTPGTNYQLGCADDPSLWRSNDDTPINYPYDIMGVGEITNAHTSGNETTNWYYYFYNWDVLTAGSGCASGRVPVQVTVWPTAISEANAGAALSLFPNPTAGETNLSLELAQATTVQVRVTNALGKLVHTQQFAASAGQNNVALATGDLAAGIYLVQVQAGDQQFVERLVIE